MNPNKPTTLADHLAFWESERERVSTSIRFGRIDMFKGHDILDEIKEHVATVQASYDAAASPPPAVVAMRPAVVVAATPRAAGPRPTPAAIREGAMRRYEETMDRNRAARGHSRLPAGNAAARMMFASIQAGHAIGPVGMPMMDGPSPAVAREQLAKTHAWIAGIRQAFRSRS